MVESKRSVVYASQMLTVIFRRSAILQVVWSFLVGEAVCMMMKKKNQISHRH